MASQKPLIGRLNKKIIVQKVTETQDSEGGLSESWADWLTRMASVVPLNGSEYFQAQQWASDVDYRIRLRFDPLTKTITPKHRVSWDGRIFDIQSAINPMEENREIVLFCKVRQ